MPKMQLPTKTVKKRGDGTTEKGSFEQEHQHISMAVPRSFGSSRLEESPGPCLCPPQPNKETVFDWFGLRLTPAKRIELMCGLLHMCQPLELRFLGSYLEDLAKKDYHILRDFEFRANSSNDLALLTDVTDPVVLSKLLICLSLLGSDNRECAGILYRTLSHVDPTMFYKNYNYSPPFRDTLHPPAYPSAEQRCGSSPNDKAARPLEHLSLLLTMASLHPAFHFHQGEKFREQLDKLDLVVEEEIIHNHFKVGAQEEMGQKYFHCSSDLEECPVSHPPCKSRDSNCRVPQTMHIEEIVLRSVTRTTREKEYNFQVKWSDSSSSYVTKTHLELENFLLKLPKNNCSESFEKSILKLLNKGGETDSCDVEKILRDKFLSAPPVFKQIRKVCSFFNYGSSYSRKPTYCRCNSHLGKFYHRECSDFSSQEEDLESYVQGHKKKHGLKSPCQGSLSSCKSLPGDSRRGGHRADLKGSVESRKSSSTRSSQEAEQNQDAEKRSLPTAKTKSRGVDGVKMKEKTIFVANGRLVPVRKPQRKDASGPDTFGETSSESYSSPSSPQHRRAESLDSEDDNNKDSDSHSDHFSKGSGPEGFLIQNTDLNDPQLKTLVQVEPPFSEPGTDHLTIPPYMHHLPYWLPNSATDSSLSLVHPLDQSLVPDVKPSSGTPVMPNAPSAVAGILADPEKKDLVASGLFPVGTSTVQPAVHRFKVALSHSQGAADVSAAAPPLPVRTVSVISPCPTPYSSPLQPDQASVDTGPPNMDTQPATNTGLTSPPLCSAFTPSTVPTSANATPSLGLVQTVVPAAAPGPPQSPSPAVTHSTAAYSDCTSYSNSNPSCGGATVTHGNTVNVQQAQQQQQQRLLGCGACGCHNNCGGRTSVTSDSSGNASGCQAPLVFAGHQMAAVRQVFNGPPPLFQLANICSSSYLPQAQPLHQVNATAALSPFFPSAPPSYGPLHSQNPAEVPSHILGMQAVAAVAAANYNIQQQMAASASSICQRVYQQQMYPKLLSMVPTATLPRSGVNKKNGNVSCYNCGISGHFAHECSNQDPSQGGFRLKYTASRVSEMLDNGN